jgi:hypothetical protein
MRALLAKRAASPDRRRAAPTNRIICSANGERAGNDGGAPYIGRDSMAIVVIFLLGIGNFTLHKAVMESGHPLLGKLPWFYHALGGQFSLGVEFLMLLAALLFAAQGIFAVVVAYIVYSMLNSFSAWLILTDRL